MIRTLLAERELPAPVSGSVVADAPTGVQTPETYLGFARLDRFVGERIVPGAEARYELPQEELPLNAVAYGGRWTVDAERIVAGEGARVRLRFFARKVHLVLGTAGEAETVEVRLDGEPLPPVHVTEDDLYTLADAGGPAAEHVVELRFTAGTEAYAFTFG